MGRRYVWHKVFEYEVPNTPQLDVDKHPDLEWLEESDKTEEEPAAKPAPKPAPPKKTTKG